MSTVFEYAPALATGNTVVLKPAETTPLTALLFAEVCQQADLPPGVVNIVTGGGDTGRAVVEHPDVNKVAFTGSTEVGRQIARSVAGTRKRLTLELGGKAANIVFDDAPIDQAVEGIVNGIFFNQGHVCCAGSRLLVQESVAEEVLDRVAEVLEGRRAQFAEEVQRSEGGTRRQAEAVVDASVDRLVWYAGWADKIAQAVGGTNPVAAPYFDFSIPEPTGVGGVLGPQGSSLLGV